MSHCGYLSTLFELDELVEAADALAYEINKDKFSLGINSLAVTGVSGFVMGGLLSYRTRLPLVVVRKEVDNHSGYSIEFTRMLRDLRYAIVDDLIASGDTVKKIISKIAAHGENDDNHANHELLKIYLYKSYKHESIIRNGGSPFYQINGVRIPIFALYNG